MDQSFIHAFIKLLIYSIDYLFVEEWNFLSPLQPAFLLLVSQCGEGSGKTAELGRHVKYDNIYLVVSLSKKGWSCSRLALRNPESLRTYAKQGSRVGWSSAFLDGAG